MAWGQVFLVSILSYEQNEATALEETERKSWKSTVSYFILMEKFESSYFSWTQACSVNKKNCLIDISLNIKFQKPSVDISADKGFKEKW